MEIDLRELKAVVVRLLDHIIETRGVQVVRIEKSNYWNIPSDQVYNPEGPPDALDVGSLVDDWDFLRPLLNPDTQPVAYQLVEAAPLLRYIGEKLGQELAKRGG